MNIQKKNSELGFTLVEMLLYMGLLSILIFVFTDIFTAIIDTQLSSQEVASVAQDGRFLYSRLIYDLNRAQSISIPASLGDTSNVLALQIDGVTYRYELSNGNLLLTDQNGSEVLNGYDTTASGLQFQRIGNINGKHTVQIHFTITGKTHLHGAVESQTFQTTAGLR